MKKQQPVSKIEDQLNPAAYHAERRSQQPSAKDFYADRLSSRPRRRISYVPGESPREEPVEMPRLFIRGLVGGSVKMDLRGLNIQLSKATFAHWVTDESLKKLHIHRGDVAIIDPIRPVLRERNLILVGWNGREVLRRLTKKNRVWFLETADGSKSSPLPLVDRPIYGVVLGVLRLFTKATARKFGGTDANFAPWSERSKSQSATIRNSDEAKAMSAHSKVRYPKRKRRPFLVAEEQRLEHRLSETKQEPDYRV